MFGLAESKDRALEANKNIATLRDSRMEIGDISVDFVMGLPRTPSRYDAIWVIVDRLTKFAQILPIRANYPLEKLAQLYI